MCSWVGGRRGVGSRHHLGSLTPAVWGSSRNGNQQMLKSGLDSLVCQLSRPNDVMEEARTTRSHWVRSGLYCAPPRSPLPCRRGMRGRQLCVVSLSLPCPDSRAASRGADTEGDTGRGRSGRAPAPGNSDRCRTGHRYWFQACGTHPSFQQILE